MSLDRINFLFFLDCNMQTLFNHFLTLTKKLPGEIMRRSREAPDLILLEIFFDVSLLAYQLLFYLPMPAELKDDHGVFFEVLEEFELFQPSALLRAKQ